MGNKHGHSHPDYVKGYMKKEWLALLPIEIF